MNIFARRNALFSLLATGVFTAFVSGQAQTLINGSFENPATTPTYAGAGDGWTTTGSASVTSTTGSTRKTPYGTQYLELIGFVSPNTGAAPATASQVIGSGFVIGNTYRLTLAAVSGNSLRSATFGISVTGGATASTSVTLAPLNTTSPDTYAFANYGLDFTVTSNAPVTFTLTDSNNATGSIIDNVNLNLVPEPSTWITTLAGLAGLGRIWRRSGRRHA